jgi:AhpD family alkylhydroperoxidase
MSKPRLSYEDFTKRATAVHSSLLEIGKAETDSGIDKRLLELLKLRVSQINGCAFCLQYHWHIARELEMDEEKLDLLPVWREAGVFSEKEKAALAWAESLTRLSPERSTDEAYAKVSKHFTAHDLLYLTVAISNINQWNRIAVAFRF